MYRFVSTTLTQAGDSPLSAQVSAEIQDVLNLVELIVIVMAPSGGVLYVSYGINISDSLFCSMIIRFNNPQRPISLFLLLQHRR